MSTTTVMIYGRKYRGTVVRETVKKVWCVARLKNGRVIEGWFRKQYYSRVLGRALVGERVLSARCARWPVDFEVCGDGRVLS